MENNNRLILQKEASSISFDNNGRFENNNLLDALSLARVESKNYNTNNFLIEPDNKNDFYPGNFLYFIKKNIFLSKNLIIATFMAKTPPI